MKMPKVADPVALAGELCAVAVGTALRVGTDGPPPPPHDAKSAPRTIASANRYRIAFSYGVDVGGQVELSIPKHVSPVDVGVGIGVGIDVGVAVGCEDGLTGTTGVPVALLGGSAPTEPPPPPPQPTSITTIAKIAKPARICHFDGSPMRAKRTDADG
jgi:hypothetical protein